MTNFEMLVQKITPHRLAKSYACDCFLVTIESDRVWCKQERPCPENGCFECCEEWLNQECEREQVEEYNPRHMKEE